MPTQHIRPSFPLVFLPDLALLLPIALPVADHDHAAIVLLIAFPDPRYAVGLSDHPTSARS